MNNILRDGKGAGTEFEHTTASVHKLRFCDPVQGNCILSSHKKMPFLWNCADRLWFCQVQARYSVPMHFFAGKMKRSPCFEWFTHMLGSDLLISQIIGPPRTEHETGFYVSPYQPIFHICDAQPATCRFDTASGNISPAWLAPSWVEILEDRPNSRLPWTFHAAPFFESPAARLSSNDCSSFSAPKELPKTSVADSYAKYMPRHSPSSTQIAFTHGLTPQPVRYNNNLL